MIKKTTGLRKLTVCILVLLLFCLCACGQTPPAEAEKPAPAEKEPAEAAELPVFGEYTGLTEFLSDNTVDRITYSPRTMGNSDEMYITDEEAVRAVVDALGKVSISESTGSFVTDWYPVIVLEADNGASLCISFDGEWLSGNPVNYVLSGMDSVWKLIKEYAHEPEPLECEGFLYFILEDGGAEIQDYTGSGDALVIPETLDGVTVTSIAPEAFNNRKEIKEISFPSTLTSIGAKAFAYCDGIELLELSCVRLDIGYDAFEYCGGLRAVVIKGEDISIERDAFHYCNSLERVEISGKTASLGKAVFEYDRALKEVILAVEGAFELGHSAFGYCENARFVVPAGSEAEARCVENKLPYTCPEA